MRKEEKKLNKRLIVIRNEDCMITIFTPTFNRAQYLNKIYNSLLSQVSNDFEWLVVDDGSKDETREIIKAFIDENKINIRYCYQPNQGKHVAFNKGIELAEGEFFICVDSDDYLADNAISIICGTIKRMPADAIGIIFPQSLNYEKNKWLNIDKTRIDIFDLKEKYGIIESAILIKTEILKKHHFPEFKNDDGVKEKFCSEGILYNELITNGNFYVYNFVIYMSNYLDNGLTNNLFKRTWINNFYGAIEDFKSRFKAASKYGFLLRAKVRIKAILNLNALCLKKRKNIYKYTPSNLYSSILLLPSLLFAFYRFK